MVAFRNVNRHKPFLYISLPNGAEFHVKMGSLAKDLGALPYFAFALAIPRRGVKLAVSLDTFFTSMPWKSSGEPGSVMI